MDNRNIAAPEILYQIDSNSKILSRFLTLTHELYTIFEKTYPHFDNFDSQNGVIAKEVAEIGIHLKIFDISVRNHDFDDIHTYFILLTELLENGFYEDTLGLQKKVFTLLQKYHSLTTGDSSPIEAVQNTYNAKLQAAQYLQEHDYISAYCEGEIEYFLSIISSPGDFKSQKSRYQNFLSHLREKEILSSNEYKKYWTMKDMSGVYELFFSLLEKNIWIDESDLKQLVGAELREYFYKKDTKRYVALAAYEVSFEDAIQSWAEKILTLLATHSIEKTPEDIDNFLNYLHQQQVLSSQELGYYMSSENMVGSICEIISYRIVLAKELNEHPELEEKWLVFLIGYYSSIGNKVLVKQVQEYASINDYTLPQVHFPITSHFDTEIFEIDSDNFHHLLIVAMDLPDRVRNMKERDFYEGEVELLKIIERFRKTHPLEEKLFQEIQDAAFEVSIYKLLKKIYFNGFFSGDIYKVEQIKNILIAIADLLCPDDIGEITRYHTQRYNELIAKERKKHIIPSCQQLYESLKEGTEKWDENIILDLVNLLKKYDTSRNIAKLHEYRKNPRIIAMECLHFSLVQGFLDTEPNLVSELYHFIKGYYISKNIGTRVEELAIYLKKIQNTFPEISEHISQSETQQIISGMRNILSLSEKGLYDVSGEKKVEELVHSLSLQGILNESERENIFRMKGSIVGFFNLFAILKQKGYFDTYTDMTRRVQKTKEIIDQLLDVSQNGDDYKDERAYNPEFLDGMVRSNTMQLLDWIKEGNIDAQADDYFTEFIHFLSINLQGDLAYSEIFGEEPEDIIDIFEREERAHALLLLLFCDFLSNDFDTMQEVYLCLKEYYYNNPEICETLNEIISPYRLLNSSSKS